MTGTAAGVALLAVLVIAFGPLLALVPLGALQLVVGILLLFFGMRWLRKAILRYAGVIALHDEASIYARQKATLATSDARGSFDWLAIATTFNAVVLEGLEVVFIVIAVGATARAILPASLGALAAGVLVVGAGSIAREPLARVPENTLKFVVGIMLTAFGTFWTGEGMGLSWPGDDLALPALIAGYLIASVAAVLIARNAPAGALTQR